MTNNTIGFLLSYTVGLPPSRIPPWGDTRLELADMIIADTTCPVMASKIAMHRLHGYGISKAPGTTRTAQANLVSCPLLSRA